MYREFQLDLLHYAEKTFADFIIEDLDFETIIGVNYEFSQKISGDRYTKPEPSIATNFKIESFRIVNRPYSCDKDQLLEEIVDFLIFFYNERIPQDLFQSEPEKFDY